MLGEKEERTREDEKESLAPRMCSRTCTTTSAAAPDDRLRPLWSSSILLQKEEEGLFTAETVIEVDAPQEV